MAFRHGKDTSVFIGGYDLSPWLNEANSATTIDTAETSHFRGQAKEYLTGLDDGAFSFSGLFDSDKTNLEDKIAAIEAMEPGAPITVATDGLVVGSRVRMGVGKKTSWEINSVISDVVSVQGDFQCTGGIKGGVLLNPALTPWASNTMFASVDQTNATTNGARVQVNVIGNSMTSTALLTVQHSANNSTWVDLALFPIAAGPSMLGFVDNPAGSILRYVRLISTFAGTGNLTAAVSIGRN